METSVEVAVVLVVEEEEAPQAPNIGATAGWAAGGAVVAGGPLVATVEPAPVEPGNMDEAMTFKPPKVAVGLAAGAEVVAMVTAGLPPKAGVGAVLPKRGLKVGTVGLVSWADAGAMEGWAVAMKMGLKPDASRGLLLPTGAVLEAVGSV